VGNGLREAIFDLISTFAGSQNEGCGQVDQSTLGQRTLPR
jgi:hypothetical protein